MKTDVCPERELLSSHLLGKLRGEQADFIDQHLETCDDCLQTARELDAVDEFTEGIRAGKPELQGSESGIDEVIERGKQLQFQNETMESDETFVANHLPQADSEPNASTGSPDTDIDFLAPAELPDEIGRLGGYRILSVLGVGGMGVVFRAEDPKLKRQIALKAMKPAVAASKSYKDRFLREAQATASIEHDNIVAIHQVGEDRGIPFIAMPYLRGESLQTYVKREMKIDQREVLRIGREVAAGLAAAHERGLIHRDIKPDNIWLEQKTPLPPGEGQLQSRRRTKQGEGRTPGEQTPSPGPSPTGRGSFDRAKVLDFGLVRAVSDDDTALTQSSVVLGTPKYMAPEQALGENIDHRCDLFSLGSVLYHLATGNAPFPGGDITATLKAVT